MKIGFIGLGNLGTPTSETLLQENPPLYLYNRTAAQSQPLAEKGAIICNSVPPRRRGVCWQKRLADLIRDFPPLGMQAEFMPSNCVVSALGALSTKHSLAARIFGAPEFARSMANLTHFSRGIDQRHHLSYRSNRFNSSSFGARSDDCDDLAHALQSSFGQQPDKLGVLRLHLRAQTHSWSAMAR